MDSIKMWVTEANLWCSHLIMGKCPQISTWKKLIKVNIVTHCCPTEVVKKGIMYL